MSGLWFKCRDCGSNVGVVVRSYKWDWDWIVYGISVRGYSMSIALRCQ